MEKKAKLALEILIVLIFVVFLSAGVLALIKAGILKPQEEPVEILNTEFIPYQRTGTLVVNKFQLCLDINENYTCLGEDKVFYLGENIHFLLTITSTVVDSKILLIENYRIIGPDKSTLLEANRERDFYFEAKSKKEEEKIYLKDSFIITEYAGEGEYTLELLLENPLLNKKLKIVKKFKIEEYQEIIEIDKE